MITSSDLDRFRDEMMSIVVKLGEGFERPDQDWNPTVMLLQPDGGRVIIGLDPFDFHSEEKKDFIAEKLTEIAREHRAVGLLQVMAAYLAPNRQHPAHQHPQGQEVVFMAEVRGDTGSRLYTAAVRRFRTGPPTLGPWILQGIPRLCGRFVDDVEPYIMASFALSQI